MSKPCSVKLTPGQLLGDLTLIKRVRSKRAGVTRWRVRCVCGVEQTVPQMYLIRPQYPKRNCGCKTYENANPYPTEKGIWHMMHRRCSNPTHVHYKMYGGIGISVCERWSNKSEEGFQNFISDLGPRPTKTHSLDRIDPYGNYEPSNCRWADKATQANNQKRHWIPPEQRKEGICPFIGPDLYNPFLKKGK